MGEYNMGRVNVYCNLIVREAPTGLMSVSFWEQLKTQTVQRLIFSCYTTELRMITPDDIPLYGYCF